MLNEKIRFSCSAFLYYLITVLAHLSYLNSKAKAFLNPEIKAKKEVVLKTFSGNTGNIILDVVELVVASKTADEDIRLQAFVTDICLPLKNKARNLQTKLFKKFRYRHFNSF